MLLPPRFLFLSINKACNLRCEHCCYWNDDDRDRARYLTPERRREILEEMAVLNPKSAVVICGGESMLAQEDYFGVARECRRLGLTCLSVINGTRVQTPEMADRMITEGPHEISVSLNSHREDLHDRTRGVAGAFRKAVSALNHLLEARQRFPGARTRIYAMGLVFDENYSELEDFYDFVLNRIGADKLKLNFIQPTFGGPKLDRFFDAHNRVDPDQLLAVLDRCEQRFQLDYNPKWKETVAVYFRTLAGMKDSARGWGTKSQTAETICNAWERNIMVDHYGTARLCFSDRFPGRPLAAPGDLRRFWIESGAVRRQMRSCRQLCGISHSVRRESTTRNRAAFAEPPQKQYAVPLFQDKPWPLRLFSWGEEG